MKNFKEYLAESERTYNYRIKIVGELPSGFCDALKGRLDQFDPLKIGTEKTTPIQAKPADFPAFENEKITSIDVMSRYPAIEPQIKQIARLLGLDENKIIMQTSVFDDSNADYQNKLADQPEPVLTSEYPKDDAKQEELKKDYSADPFDHAVLKNAYRSNFTIAGGKTKPAETTNDLPMGVKSPMTTPEPKPKRPATGANPRRI